MKKIYLLTLFSIFSLNLYCQVHWTKHPGNPVFEPGEAGTWDDLSVLMPSVLEIRDTLHLWYGGFSAAGESGIGHAFSTDDGLTWTRNPENPVLNTGPEGSWDEDRAYIPQVIYDETNSIFHLWYIGANASGKEESGYASSTDGIHWTKYASNPIDMGVGSAAILLQDNKFHAWYNYWPSDDKIAVGYAISDDGITWSEVGKPVMSPESGKWDYPRVQSSSVQFDGNTYHLWYSGGGFMSWQIGYATSTDGITWKKHESNPVMGIGGAGSWDAQFVGFPSVIFDSDRELFRMWYCGGKEDIIGSIGYAESDARLPALWVKSKTIVDTSDIDTDTLVAEIHKDGIIYIVPEGTSPVNDSIVKYKLASVEATANTEVHIPLADFSLGKYTVVAVSNQEFVSPNPQLLWVVDDDTPPALTVAEDTVEIGDTIRVTSTKEGIVYLLRHSIEEPDLSRFRDPINFIDSLEVNANDPVGFLTSDLFEFYNYYLYAVDIYGLFSEQGSVYLKEATGGTRTEEILKSGIRIYPNPAKDLLTVEMDKPGWGSLEITSLNGQLLYSTVMKGTSQRIDLSSFHKGVYFITVRSRDYVRTEKIIKL